jgi:hypothetical protein
MDGWSYGVLFKDLPAIYTAIESGNPVDAAVPPLPVQFSDFAKWHLDWVETSAAEQELEWWKRKLEGASTLLQLPLDFPRPEILSHRGDIFGLPVSPKTSQALELLMTQTGTSVVALTLTAYKLMLHTFSGMSDIIVGIPQSTREPGTDNLIGYFLNTVPVRSQIDPAMTLRELLMNEAQQLRATSAHRYLPFANIVEALNIPRSSSHDPLVQYMLTFDDIGKMPSLECPRSKLYIVCCH